MFDKLAEVEARHDELTRLLTTERPEVVQTVSWAASNGDRSENGDYIYGKRRLREIDRRLRFLTKRLEAAEVVDPAAVGGDSLRQMEPDREGSRGRGERGEERKEESGATRSPARARGVGMKDLGQTATL